MQDQNTLKFYDVIVKHEERYAIWPTGKAPPAGWRSIGKQGKRAECLDYLKMVWRTRTCLLNPRKEVDAVSTPALMVVAEKIDAPRSLPVDGLSSREHQVGEGIRGDDNLKALTLSRKFGWVLTWILTGQAAVITAVIFSVITKPEKTAAKRLLWYRRDRVSTTGYYHSSRGEHARWGDLTD
jgi:MbtH protein